MGWNDSVKQRGLIYFVPLSIVLSLILTVFFSGGLSILWVIGAVSMAGSMLLVLCDRSLGRRNSYYVFLFQVVVLLVSAVLPDRTDDGWLSPRLIMFGLGVGVAMCTSMIMSLLSKCGDSDFLFGEYHGKDFILDAMRVVYSMVQITVLLLVAVTYSAGPVARFVVCLVSLILSVGVFILIQLRFSSMYEIRKRSELAVNPSDSELGLYGQIVDVLESNKLYLNPSLTVDEISKALGTNRSYISRCINACTGLSVPRFINNYRVRYAMELYRGNTKLKVADLAAMSGFGNGITFATAFRLETNMNPRDWCRDVRDEVAKERKRLSRKKAREQESAGAPSLPDEEG